MSTSHGAAGAHAQVLLEQTPQWAAARAGDVAALDAWWAALTRSASAASAAALLRQVGGEGATLLHYALLYYEPDSSADVSSNRHVRVVSWLLAHARDLLTMPYGAGVSALYTGEGALHMAIAKGDLRLVRWLMEEAAGSAAERSALLHARATGRFFQPGASAYYGEWPLSFAVCMNAVDIVSYLVQRFGDVLDLSRGDALGNCAGHMCAWYGLAGMYSLLRSLWDAGLARPAGAWASVPFDSIVNNDGCVPLVVAARRNRVEMFRAMWEEDTSSVSWRWGNVTARRFDLQYIDYTPRTIKVDAATYHSSRSTEEAAGGGGGGASAEDAAAAVTVSGAALTPTRSGAVASVLGSLQAYQPLLESDSLPPPSPALPSSPAARGGGGAQRVVTDKSKSAALLGNRRQKLFLRAKPPTADPATRDSHGAAPPQLADALKTVMDVVAEDSLEKIIATPHVLQLLQLKWRHFGFSLFLAGAALDGLFLALFMAMSITRSALPATRAILSCPADGVRPADAPDAPPCEQAIALELAVLAATLARIAYLASSVLLRHNYFARLRGATGLQAGLCAGRDALIVAAALVELCGGAAAGVSRFLWAAAAVAAWTQGAFYLLAFETTGPFVVILSEMMTVDVLPITAILFLVYAGFVQGFVALADAGAGDFGGEGGVPLFRYLLRTLLEWIIVPDFVEGEEHDAVFLFPAFLYNFVITIVVLNLLIALFNETFVRIMHKSATNQWNLERARLMLNMEANMPEDVILWAPFRYWVDVGGHPFLLDEDVDAKLYEAGDRAAAVRAATASVKQGRLDYAPFPKRG